MKIKNVYLISSFFLLHLSATAINRFMRVPVENKADITWTVIGAGPAGITIVGLLLELGVPKKEIMWIDDQNFEVGDFGKYSNVPSNAPAENYIQFLKHCSFFNTCHTEAVNELLMSDPNKEYNLSTIIKPLQDITALLQSQVTCIYGHLTALQFEENEWTVEVGNQNFSSHNVVLATGSHPRTLTYACKNEIPLGVAIDKQALSNVVETDETIALVGGSHSAILVLKYLSELGVKRILNFYKHPIRYAYNMGDGNPTSPNGLKGETGRWAYQVLEQDNSPISIFRLKNTKKSRDHWLGICNKIIYAIGYEPNELPIINDNQNNHTYDDRSGIIAPRLFGIGIAFPEAITNEDGSKEHIIGLIDFMEYAKRILPEWAQCKNKCLLKEFTNLFTITRL